MPDSVKAFVDVQQSVPGFAPPPPTLPSNAPSHIKAPVDAACRAAKIAWMTETKRADLAGAEISDENLNKLYKRAREWYSRHAKASEVHALHRTRTCCLTCVWILPSDLPLTRGHVDELVYECESAEKLQRATESRCACIPCATLPQCLLRHLEACAHLCAGIKQPVVEGMAPQEVRRKVRHEQEKNATRLQPSFPAAVQEDVPKDQDLQPLPCANSHAAKNPSHPCIAHPCP